MKLSHLSETITCAQQAFSDLISFAFSIQLNRKVHFEHEHTYTHTQRHTQSTSDWTKEYRSHHIAHAEHRYNFKLIFLLNTNNSMH